MIFRELNKDESQSISDDEIKSHFTGKYMIDITSEIETHPKFNNTIQFDVLKIEYLHKIFLYDCFYFDDSDDENPFARKD